MDRLRELVLLAVLLYVAFLQGCGMVKGLGGDLQDGSDAVRDYYSSQQDR